MALGEKSFFWDKPAGELTAEELEYYQYSGQDLASVYESMYTTGISPAMAVTSAEDNPNDYIGSSLAVTAGDGLGVTMSPGVAMIKGRPYIASLPVQFTVSAGQTTDIVLRMDLQTDKPEIYAAAKQRASGTTLVNNITHDSLVYEIALATIAVPSGSVQITPAMITDQRLNTTEHPTDSKPIAGLMKTIPYDTLGIWEDYQALDQYIKTTWAAFLSDSQTEFETWFAQLQATLDENVAANLENQIIALQGGKADTADLTAHTGDTDIHVTAAQKAAWDGKVNKSGDEMTGDLRINKSQFPRVLLKESTNNTQSQIMLGTRNLAMGIYNVQEGNTYRQLTLFNSDAKTLEQAFALADVVSGTTNLYPVYGTHNVTVSTAAPTTTLGNGVMHMVYDA